MSDTPRFKALHAAFEAYETALLDVVGTKIYERMHKDDDYCGGWRESTHLAEKREKLVELILEEP